MRPGSLIGPIITAIGLVAAALVFAVVFTLLGSAEGGVEPRIEALERAIGAAEEDTRQLRRELDDARTKIRQLEEELRRRSALPQSAPTTSAGVDQLLADPGAEEFVGTEALTEEMKIARQGFNQGITQPGSRFMLQMLGNPRESYGQDCRSITNPRLKAAVETRQIGPIRVTMLKPALDSLERVMNRLKDSDPDIYEKVGTAGALCVRFIRGSNRSISNHSWGTAIDVKLEGVLDPFADGGTHFGLLILAEYFNDEGWFWGATYGREDSMHFEVGAEQIQAWVGNGQI